MNVELLHATADAEFVVAQAAYVCYAQKIPQLFSIEKARNLIRKLIKSEHLSPLEHATFTVYISGLSRTATHQLVRHRIASYSQQSQRYTLINPQVVIPPTIMANAEAKELYTKTYNHLYSVYTRLISLGIPKEDARYIMPQGTVTNIVVTMNARQWLHFFKLRCCERTQWELRQLAYKILELLRSYAPAMFESAGPACVTGTCPEGELSCGKYKIYESRK